MSSPMSLRLNSRRASAAGATRNKAATSHRCATSLMRSLELRVRFTGEIRRQDLVTRFGIQSAAASRNMALRRKLAPGNIDYDPKGKSYVR